MDSIATICREQQGLGMEAVIKSCHQALIDKYPGLQLRWSRVYGKRWSHVYGEGNASSLNKQRVELGPNWGLYIDNPEAVNETELNSIIQALKAGWPGECSR
ncbi:hypothetical protein [Syntrophomonas palmitatica]|uniref:hypothetical protein n=1 Tax=Syntrophomonas palmitatica TaxID=402877 RepID=UPI0006D002A4|nr:hypothetical protein [Syntrophomonas palmitatica]